MNSVQFAIVIVILLLIIVLIGYYFYQEHQFKKLVENNFNQASNDVLGEPKSFVVDGVYASKPILNVPNIKNNKDTYTKQKNVAQEINFDLYEDVQDEIPADSAEAFFVALDNAKFDYELDLDLDACFDIAFEDVIKIKALPEINHLTHKECRFYVFEKNGNWISYTQSQKYVARGIRIVVPLIDKNGLISQAQLSNIYNELHAYVLKNGVAHLRVSDYARSMVVLQGKVKYLESIPLELNLYLIIKEKIHYSQLCRFFLNEGMQEKNGVLVYPNGNKYPICYVYDENGNQFATNNEYNMLSLKAQLHLHNNPFLDRYVD